MTLLSVQIKKYGGEVLAVTNGENHKIFSVIAKPLKNGGKVLADTNGKQALRLVLMEKNVRYVPVRE